MGCVHDGWNVLLFCCLLCGVVPLVQLPKELESIPRFLREKCTKGIGDPVSIAKI
jgi:hypothetical protein